MPTIAKLIAELEAADPAAQASSAEALSRRADDNQAALVALTRLTASSDESVAQWCNAALENAGPPGDDQIEALAGLVRHQNSTVAYWAATLLGRAGRRATSAMPALASRLGDNSSAPLQDRIAWALARIDAESPSTTRAVSH